MDENIARALKDEIKQQLAQANVPTIENRVHEFHGKVAELSGQLKSQGVRNEAFEKNIDLIRKDAADTQRSMGKIEEAANNAKETANTASTAVGAVSTRVGNLEGWQGTANKSIENMPDSAKVLELIEQALKKYEKPLIIGGIILAIIGILVALSLGGAFSSKEEPDVALTEQTGSDVGAVDASAADGAETDAGSAELAAGVADPAAGAQNDGE